LKENEKKSFPQEKELFSIVVLRVFRLNAVLLIVVAPLETASSERNEMKGFDFLHFK
jgi:hypothetical protein